MSSKVQQIQLSYNSQEDRILLTISTDDFNEFRFWLTRRVTMGLWEMLKKLQEISFKPPEQIREEKATATRQIHKETAKPEAAKYTTRVTKCPLGDTPILVFKFSARASEQGHVFFHFEDANGIGIDFAGEDLLISVISQLLQKAAGQADWALPL